MKNFTGYTLLFINSLIFISTLAVSQVQACINTLPVNITEQDTLHLQSDELKIVVVNNEAYGDLHRAGYNGISELYPNGSDRNFFRPDAGGMNFEFILNGDSSTFGYERFAPRNAPMKLERLGPDKVQLTQERTEDWPLKSTITFELTGNRVEMVYEGVPFEDIGGKFEYTGLFFASYIRGPEEKGIRFIGKKRSENASEAKWLYHLPAAHGVEANHRPAGSAWDPRFDEDFPITLASGFSDLEYLYPFYYGISGEFVLIKMFERTDENTEMRFAQSPTGGGPENPAWDFLYFNKKPVTGKAFGFRAAIVIKKFEGVDDVIEQYEKWSGETVTGFR